MLLPSKGREIWVLRSRFHTSTIGHARIYPQVHQYGLRGGVVHTNGGPSPRRSRSLSRVRSRTDGEPPHRPFSIPGDRSRPAEELPPEPAFPDPMGPSQTSQGATLDRPVPIPPQTMGPRSRPAGSYPHRPFPIPRVQSRPARELPPTGPSPIPRAVPDQPRELPPDQPFTEPGPFGAKFKELP